MPPEQELHYTDITDFSPGIFQGYGPSGAAIATPAPLGAAQLAGTYRCMTMLGGGLRPGPKRTQAFSLGLSDGAATTPIYMTGMQAMGPVIPLGGSIYQDTIWLTYSYQAGGTRKQVLARLNLNKNPFTLEPLKTKTTNGTGPFFWGSTFAVSRMSPSSTDPTLVGTPVIVAEYSDTSNSPFSANYLIAIPDPAAPTVFGYKSLVTEDSSFGGQVIGHQGRIVQLGINTWGVADPTLTAGTFNNEQINCTDPANSSTFLFASEVFLPEFPTGYGAWGSISAGELLLIKHKGGAVMVSGDVLNPQITRLAGVVGTGFVGTRTASSKGGLLYATRSGIHTWTGGQSSQHISPQLWDQFWSTGIPLVNQQVGIADWLDWAVVSNGWLFDIDKNSWWQIDNPSDFLYPLQWFDRSIDGRFLYGVTTQVSSPGGGSENTLFVWDRLTYASNYSWQSQPIPGSINRFINVRELVLVAQGTGTITITCTAADNTTNVATFTLTSPTQPIRQRQTIGVKGFNIVLKIVSDGGSGEAPVVYSLGVGTYESLHAQART